MSQTYQCGDNTALVGYMYGECEPGDCAVIEAHVAVCAACAAELAALESTRVQLASWTPPGADLGFVISRPHPSTIARGALSEVEEQASGPRAQQASGLTSSEGRGLGPWAWYRQPMPAWAQAAAAGVIFAAGLWLGVARGSMPAAPPPAAAVSVPAVVANTASAGELSALEQRLRTEIAQIRTAASTPATGPQSRSEAQLLASVRGLIDESEQRQQRELALRTAQVMRDFDSQRSVDLAQIQRSFGQIEGLAGAEVREQREMLNYLMRVTQQR